MVLSGAAHLHAVVVLEGRVQRHRAKSCRARSGKRAGSSQAVSSASGPPADRGQPVQPEQPPGPVVERLPDILAAAPTTSAQVTRERRLQALAAQRLGEAAQQADLLDDLVVADERALAPDPQQVAPADQVEQGLAGPGPG